MNKTHPGKLIEANLDALNLSVVDAAKAMQITHQQLSNVIRGNRAISPDLASRLDKVMGGSGNFWQERQRPVDRDGYRMEEFPEITGRWSNQRKIKCEWAIAGVVLEFSSLKNAKAFEKFHVLACDWEPAAVSDKCKPESVLADISPAYFLLNKKNSKVSVFREGKIITVDAAITFEVPVKRGVTVDKFNKWITAIARTESLPGNFSYFNADAELGLDQGFTLRAVSPGQSVPDEREPWPVTLQGFVDGMQAVISEQRSKKRTPST